MFILHYLSCEWWVCVGHCVQAVTTPSMAVSHIMLEAYKKYLLVALILHGKVKLLQQSGLNRVNGPMV